MMEPSLLIPGVMFYVFSGVLLVSAILVITVKNPVHSVLFLILGFFNSAGLFLILGAEFIAMLTVIVYVGAVAVLFLFVVMMLDVDINALKEGFVKYLPICLVVAVILASELIMVMTHAREGTQIFTPQTVPLRADMNNTETIGSVLYTTFVYPFQLAGLVLLVAMIGAIVLTLRSRPGVKKQNIDSQVNRKREDAMEVVSVETGKGV